MNAKSEVVVRTEEISLPTFLPAPPDKNPMFLENRVYQGSSGRVYPLPFTDRIAETKVERSWKVVWLENKYICVMLLPELGGRVHAIQDKSNGFDLIYNQPVIKPALVGLAGPWASGGIEFNWPQHHRPATFLPVDIAMEENADGSKTVWCGDHDPMARMKGMHGICLHPDKAYVELKVRVFNRTAFTQSFLWWANMAIRVHQAYQSFFPPDVQYVADHAKRAVREYPLCQGTYYGVNYAERALHGTPKAEYPPQFVPPHCGGKAPIDYAPNDLSFYANIPTPCSYMALGSKEDFCGGYDHFAQAGIILQANHHISPGKKQWTWGNHPFGYAWDRNLTEPNAQGEYSPYIELMTGVYTDNQPDFSFLQPGETKTWSQFWYPIQNIGPAQHANIEGALSLRIAAGKIHIGICVNRVYDHSLIRLKCLKKVFEWTADLSPGNPFLQECPLKAGWVEEEISVCVLDKSGREIISYAPKPKVVGDMPKPATVPAMPADVANADELYVIGLHLDQYRHVSRCPTLYWGEALRRDPLDARCNNAMGLWQLRRGSFDIAENHFRQAIQRLTQRNPNPYDGEPFYNLGLCLRYQLNTCSTLQSQIHDPRFEEAYAAFYKSTWNQAWSGVAYHALAEMDCQRANWPTAQDHLQRALRLNTDNLRVRDLQVLVLRKLGCISEAESLLRETLAMDPLDWWARHLAGEAVTCDLQARLDVAHDYARAGFYAEAVDLLQNAVSPRSDLPDQSWGAAPLMHYTLGWLYEKLGDNKSARGSYQQAAAESPDYCFPARLEEMTILQGAMRANSKDSRASYYLGNFFYDRRRHAEAIRLWEQSAKLDPSFSIVWRNLGIGYFNINQQSTKARLAYEKAIKANPTDARLIFERDQLWKNLGETPSKRLRELEKNLPLVRQRDDLSLELCALYCQNGQPAKALEIVGSRKFQPWEGGEGGPLGQHVRARLSLGREAFARKDFEHALEHFTLALESPENLGEAKHLLANQSDIHYWLGCALNALGKQAPAREHWETAAHFNGDFQQMSVRKFSEMTYYIALSWAKLGKKDKAAKLLRQLQEYAQKLKKSTATIDYFATSVPAMLLFNDNPQQRQETTAKFLEAQACAGPGAVPKARSLLRSVLRREPNHAMAADLIKELRSVSKVPRRTKGATSRLTRGNIPLKIKS